MASGPRQHAKEHLQSARQATDDEVGGYDERRLIKIELTEKVPPESVANVARGIEIVSQEEGQLVLAFATNDQLDNFDARLATLTTGGSVTYRDVMYALRIWVIGRPKRGWDGR